MQFAYKLGFASMAVKQKQSHDILICFCGSVFAEIFELK